MSMNTIRAIEQAAHLENINVSTHLNHESQSNVPEDIYTFFMSFTPEGQEPARSEFTIKDKDINDIEKAVQLAKAQFAKLKAKK